MTFSSPPAASHAVTSLYCWSRSLSGLPCGLMPNRKVGSAAFTVRCTFATSAVTFCRRHAARLAAPLAANCAASTAASVVG